MPRCTTCGEWVDEDERFCDSCGVRISEDAGGTRWKTRATDADDIDHGRSTRESPQGHTDPTRAANEAVAPPKRESILQFVLRHPLRRGRRPVLVSAALLVGGILVIPALLLAGYSYRVGRSVVLEEEQPPAYTDLGRLAMDGIRLVIVVSLPTLLWTLGTLVILGILLVGVPASGRLVPLVTALSAAGLLWFAGAYVVAFVGSNSVVGAFRDGRAGELRSDPAFLRNWLFVVVLSAVVLVALSVASVPVVVLSSAGVPTPVVWGLSGLSLAGAGLVLAYAGLVGVTHAGYVYHGAADRGVVPAPEQRTETGSTALGIQ
jgi:hypothetical protein